MPWYLTEYPIIERFAHAASYGAEVWARDFREAVRTCTKRGLGETIVSAGYRKPMTHTIVSDLMRRRPNAHDDLIHAAAFLCFVALSAGVINVRQALGDAGLVHQLIHRKITGRPHIKTLIPLAEEIERLTPGWLPPARERRRRKAPKPKAPKRRRKA